jgi:putative FmdB family regulatory protein
MPIYEYRCTDCGQQFDALRSMSKADAPIECEQCESLNTARLVSAAVAHCAGRNGGDAVAGGRIGSGCGGCRGGSCSSCGH